MWDLVTRPGINPGPVHWDCSLRHWTTMKVPSFLLLLLTILLK